MSAAHQIRQLPPATALLTLREVAEVIGCSPRHAQRTLGHLAQRNGVKARNGKSVPLFPITALPAPAQFEWAKKQATGDRLQVTAPEEPSGQLGLTLTVPAGPNMSAEDQAEAEQRYKVIAPLLEPASLRALCVHYGSKQAAIAALAAEHQVGSRSIHRWLQRFKSGGMPALLDKGRKDKGQPKALNAAGLAFLLSAALPEEDKRKDAKHRRGLLRIREIWRVYKEEMVFRARMAGKVLAEPWRKHYAPMLDASGRFRPDAQLTPACYGTFKRWFNRINPALLAMAREGEKAYSDTQEILTLRDIAGLQPMEYVVMDHRQLDIFCMVRDQKSGGWKLIRPWLTAAIDNRTRKWLAWIICETPSSDSIAACLKRVFLDHGLPQYLYWDNGKDFRCEWFEGSNRVRGEKYKTGELDTAWHGMLQDLGVKVTHAIVHRARSKVIEPNFKTLAEFERSLPWWCGNKPQARPPRFNALVAEHERWTKDLSPRPPFETLPYIAWLYDEQFQTLNAREHTGEGMDKPTPRGMGWKSPDECWDELIGKVERNFPPPEKLLFSFMKRKELQVRNGMVSPTFGGKLFHYRNPDNPLQLEAFNTHEVSLAYDPNDLGTAAVFFEDRFVCLVGCVELRRMREEGFKEDERDRRSAAKQIKHMISAIHRQVYVPGAEVRALRRMETRPIAPPALPPATTISAHEPAPITAQVIPQGSMEPAGSRADEQQQDDGEFRFSRRG